jgi:outer membrane protein assembly factor BamB
VKFPLFISLFFCAVIGLSAFDWPTYGGLTRDHRSTEKGLQLEWVKEPKILWEKKVGLGYSSVIDVSGFAYTQGYENNFNTLYCIDTATGKTVWTHKYSSELGDKYFQGGSRSTPTIFQGTLYLQGHGGELFALDAKSGDLIWSRHLVRDFDGIRPTWGYAGAPLVVEEKLIVQTGSSRGSLLALNRLTGSEIWVNGSAGAGYASPYTRKSAPNQIVVFNQRGLSIHQIGNGKEILHYPHVTRYEVNAAQPLDLGEEILVASAYGKGAALVNLQDREPKAVWESDGISCQMASLVHQDGYAYGIHGQTGTRSSQATLFCLDLKSGNKVWEERGFGVGTVILVDQTLVVLSDRGELALIRADPKEFHEINRFQVLAGKDNWIPPTYANGRMHCRSSKGQWVCLDMAER